jgi:hypothetical protein
VRAVRQKQVPELMRHHMAEHLGDIAIKLRTEYEIRS